MASVFDVAKYILQKTGNDITTMKLQKLVYYAQAWSLVWDDDPLFENDFQAWANGPVCAELFSAHRGMYKIDSEHLADGNPDLLTDDQKETVDIVFGFYGNKTGHWLSAQTHSEPPWINARRGCADGEALF